MEKSLARAAYFPSFPTMPIPILAHYIIPTSFPPSPTQNTLFLVISYSFKVI